MLIIRSELVAKKDTPHPNYSTLRAYASSQLLSTEVFTDKIFDSPFY